MNWLLIFVPITIAVRYLRPASETLIFILACVAIIPLAGWLGRATEHLANRTGEGIGGLLNATFGNAAELIIALAALKAGIYEMVKASLTGSIIGNILLVLGASVLAGGVRYKKQEFNAVAARAQSTMLTLAAIALMVPAAYHHLAGSAGRAKEDDLSLEISLILLSTYALSLLFSLHTHKQLFTGNSAEGHGAAHNSDDVWSVTKSVAVLGVATVFIAWISEILVGSVESAAHAFGMTRVFVGVIVVAIIGNAAEHSSAVIAAWRNRMDLALGVAIGSSVQVALFVAPVLVLASYFIGPKHLNLVFTPAEVMAIGAAVIITEQIASDGESNWLEGVQLLAVYAVLGLVFYFLPGE
ncbi:MAG: calcium/proton exchanger [Bryobacteraceae bacterium]